jgi:hypothetical protein
MDPPPEETPDYEEWQTEEEALAQAEEFYEVFRDSFETQLAGSPASAVRARHHSIILKIYTELHFAKSAFDEAEAARTTSGVAWMNLMLVAYLRAFRGIEWYHSQLGEAAVEAMAQPFTKYLKPDTKIKAREFFRLEVMTAFRNSVLDEAFEPLIITKELQTFYTRHREGRNKLAHTIADPIAPVTKACVSDAIAFHNLVANKLDSFNPIILDNV